MAECVHAIPGRARFRVPALRHSDTVAQALHHRLDGVAGIQRVVVRRQSASIIVHHDPTVLSSAELHILVVGETPPAPAAAEAAASPSRPAPPHAPCRARQAIRYVSGVAGAAALNTILERAVKAGIGVMLRSARIPI